jgi:hypothetical protein
VDVSNKTTRDPEAEVLIDNTAGIVAHGLLNTMAVIGGAAELLRTEWDAISAERRNDLFQLIELHVAEASHSLVGMVQGLPPEALDLLEGLSRLRDEPVPDQPPRLRRRSDQAVG